LPGRTPALAVAAFKAELQQVVSCVTDAVLGISRSGYEQANTPHSVSLGLDSVPLAGLFQVVTLDFTLRRLGAFGQGALVFALALARTNIHWTAGKVLVLALMPVWSIPIFASVWVVGATSAFWAVRSMEILNSVTYGGQLLTQYPLQVFGAWIQRLVIFVVPLAFVNYFPSLYVLGKPDPLGAPGIVRFISPFVAIVLVVVAGRIWNFGVRHYRSTGS
jgi:ABC-2 type transport system permease protein